jgi:hypothetical protein
MMIHGKEEKPKKIDITPFLNKLQQLIDKEKSNYLERKYAFLTIRTAYYNGNHNLINTLFEKHFAQMVKKIIYTIGRCILMLLLNKNASVDIANIMAYSSEKRYACYYYFHDKFNLQNALVKQKQIKKLQMFMPMHLCKV